MGDGLNRVMLLGALGAEPELRFTQGGQAVLNMRLATNESYLDKDKVRRERTDWHSIVVWGKRAEGLAKILHKGARIFVEGSIRTSSYDDREGVKKWKTEIVALDVLFAGERPRFEDGPNDAGHDPPSAGGGSDLPSPPGTMRRTQHGGSGRAANAGQGTPRAPADAGGNGDWTAGGGDPPVDDNDIPFASSSDAYDRRRGGGA